MTTKGPRVLDRSIFPPGGPLGVLSDIALVSPCVIDIYVRTKKSIEEIVLKINCYDKLSDILADRNIKWNSIYRRLKRAGFQYISRALYAADYPTYLKNVAHLKERSLELTARYFLKSLDDDSLSKIEVVLWGTQKN